MGRLADGMRASGSAQVVGILAAGLTICYDEDCDSSPMVGVAELQDQESRNGRELCKRRRRVKANAG